MHLFRRFSLKPPDTEKPAERCRVRTVESVRGFGLGVYRVSQVCTSQPGLHGVCSGLHTSPLLPLDKYSRSSSQNEMPPRFAKIPVRWCRVQAFRFHAGSLGFSIGSRVVEQREQSFGKSW